MWEDADGITPSPRLLGIDAVDVSFGAAFFADLGSDWRDDEGAAAGRDGSKPSAGWLGCCIAAHRLSASSLSEGRTDDRDDEEEGWAPAASCPKANAVARMIGVGGAPSAAAISLTL